MNPRLSTEENCIALSHARRFGKSHASGMIDAYYSRGCDSYEFFKDTEIATKDNFRKYMNQYNVIHLDIASFWDDYKDNIVEKIVHQIQELIRKMDNPDYEMDKELWGIK